MVKSNSKMAKQVALAASAFEHNQTGHVPKSVTVVLSEETVLITLRGALSLAETALAKEPAGADQVQEFHRQLFINSCGSLRREIKKITGVGVREATSGVATESGTVVQVFLLADSVTAGTWNGNGRDGQA